MFDRHDTEFFLRYNAETARRGRKRLTWIVAIIATFLMLADPRGISLKHAIIAAAVVAGVWVLSFAVEKLNAAWADAISDPD